MMCHLNNSFAEVGKTVQYESGPVPEPALHRLSSARDEELYRLQTFRPQKLARSVSDCSLILIGLRQTC